MTGNLFMRYPTSVAIEILGLPIENKGYTPTLTTRKIDMTNRIIIRTLTVCALLSGIPSAADESTKADPRAVEACQRESETFVQVAECLPEAHVSVVALDAFSEIYPPEADNLKSRCVELNDTITGARACVTEAIKAAIGLKEVGASLDDPLFIAVSSPDDWSALQSAIESAKSAFPDRGFWGMTSYMPFRK